MKNIYLRFFLVIVIVFFAAQQIKAVKAYPYPIEVTQPDGKKLIIRLGGDEHFKFTTTADGVLIKKDIDGYYKYAKLSNNKLVTTGTIAKNIAERSLEDLSYIQSLNATENIEAISTLQSQKSLKKVSSTIQNTTAFPTTGSPRSLVILVNFKDKAFVTSSPKTAFQNLLNQEGYAANGGTGSAKDYFISSSFGQFSPQFDVVGPFTLPDSLNYYGKNDGGGDDLNPQQMVIDACAKANQAGVDFTIYDTDNDGIVDNIFIYYAGYNEAEGAPANTIWPHRWSLNDHNTTFDGKVIYDYACTSELKGTAGSNMCGIGTFCHEFGHVLGLADFYHTALDKKTLEDWSIMDAGPYLNQGRTPPLYSSYERFAVGWLTPTQLTSSTNVVIKPLNLSNKAYLISENDNHNLLGSNPNPKEFFLIENRVKQGFDAYLPGAGMLIWHIDYDKTEWDNNTVNNYSGFQQSYASHMRVYLQPLLGNTTTPGAAFTSGSFSPVLWDGTYLNKPISEIIKESQIVNFKYKGGNFDMLPPVATEATNITANNFVANWETVENAAGYYLTCYRFDEGSSTETEGFNTGLSLPISWQSNISSITNSEVYSGQAAPALLFVQKNDYIQTCKYPEPVNGLSFHLNSLASNNGKILVEAFNGLNWTSVEEITMTSTLNTTKQYSFDVADNFFQFRISYTNVNMTVSIDDISVSYPYLIEYEGRDKWRGTNNDTILHLVSGKEYRYFVRAHDDYDNLTEISNKISTVLSVTTELKRLRVDIVRASNEVYVYPTDLSTNLLIYDITGRTVANFKPTNLKTNITKYLHKNNVYILKSGSLLNKIIY